LRIRLLSALSCSGLRARVQARGTYGLSALWFPHAGGQATLLLLGAMAALLAGALLLGSWGMALGARGKHQRASDLAAVSAARAMADVYPRLFEPPVLPDGKPSPRHLSLAAYERLGRNAALEAGRRNGVRPRSADVRFPRSFAPTRVTVVARGEARVRVHGSRRRASRTPVRARATAELTPSGTGPGLLANASDGGYSGPLAYRQGKPMRPDVARAFDRRRRAPRGHLLIVVSGYRSDAEQAKLFAAQPTLNCSPCSGPQASEPHDSVVAEPVARPVDASATDTGKAAARVRDVAASESAPSTRRSRAATCSTSAAERRGLNPAFLGAS
jgi:hypothetical protein